MKSENIKLGKQVNEHIWKHGIKNPPHHVKITAIKEEDGTVKAELEGFKFKEAIKSKKKEEKATGLKGKLQDALGKDEKKSEEKTEDETPKKEIEEKSKPIAKKTTTKKTSKQKTTKTAKTKNTTKKTETSKK